MDNAHRLLSRFERGKVRVRRALLFGCAVAAITVAFGRAAFAQESATLRGTIVSQTGEPVAHVQVELLPERRRLVSLDDGTFFFRQVPYGPHQLSFRRIGFRPVTIDVAHGSPDTTISVVLSAVPAILDSVRVRERAGRFRVTAIVVDDTDAPIANAEVVAAGLDNKLRTDSLGRVSVRNARRGTLMLRIRKIGYEPYLGSFRVEGEREDTLRMVRLAQSLAEREILARSGFGRDTFVFLDLHARLAWKSQGAGIISREELESLGKMNLCEALPLTTSGATAGIRTDPHGCQQPVCVLINGDRALMMAVFVHRERSGDGGVFPWRK